MTKRSFLGRIAAIVGSVALVGMAMVAPAHAAPGNIDQTTGSLTLYKHVQDPNSTKRQPSGDPLKGVEFTAYRVTTVQGSDPAQPIDLSDKATSDAIGSNDYAWDPGTKTVSIPKANGTTYATTEVSTQTTDQDGKAAWDELPLGLYMVVEGNDTADPSNNIVEKAAPFLVAIPYVGDTAKNADGSNANTWIYDVVIYPKNSTGTITKAITNPGDTLGKGIEFSLTVPIPYLPDQGSFRSFSISDTLDTRLTYVADSAAVTVQDASDNSVSATLEASTDYTLTTDKNEAGNTVVKVTLTDSAGLKAVTDNQGKNLVLTFKADATGVGDILNSAIVNINGKDVDSNEVTTPWGQLTLHKTDTETNEASLTGAEFELYRSTVDNATTDTPFSDNTVEKVALTADNVADAAQVTVDGKLVADDEGNAVVKVLKPGIYFLKETKAPEGYILDATPKVVEVVSGETADAVNYLQVVNDKRPSPGLPLTGSEGQLVLAAGGVTALLLAGGTILVAGRRRKH